MSWGRSLLLQFISIYLSLTACQRPSSSNLSSQVSLPEAPGDVPNHIWRRLEAQILHKDWWTQRDLAWQLQQWLFRRQDLSSDLTLPQWQRWYDPQDLRLIFRELYQGLGPLARQQRQGFSRTAIEKILADRNFGHHQRSKARLSHILFNELTLKTMLENYALLDRCYRQGTETKACDQLQFPPGSAWLKSAWRRSGSGYDIPNFPMDPEAFAQQQAAPTWIEAGTVPADSPEIYRITSDSGAHFYLVGLHLMLKLKEDWLWTTLWLGDLAGKDFAADAPDDASLASYRMCSIYSFSSPLRDSAPVPEDQTMAPIARALQRLPEPNWCSNPYLEHGPNNQKTQCIGCHQYAGLDFPQKELLRRLSEDLPSLIHDQKVRGPSDFVWSLLRGPQPIVLSIVDSIEYFDAYDPYTESLK